MRFVLDAISPSFLWLMPTGWPTPPVTGRAVSGKAAVESWSPYRHCGSGGSVSPEPAYNSLAAATGRDVLTVGPQEIVEMKTSQYPFTSDSEGSNRMDLADHGFMRDREHPPASWLGSQYFHRRRCDE